MVRLLAVLLCAQLGCSVVFNRVPERKVGPGDQFSCTTSHVPALVDFVIAVGFFVPMVWPNECGEDGCHSAALAKEKLAAIFSIPFIVSALWGLSAASTCKDSYKAARVDPPERRPPVNRPPVTGARATGVQSPDVRPAPLRLALPDDARAVDLRW